MRHLLLLCMTLALVIFGPSSQAAVDDASSISGQDVELTAPAAVGGIPADVVADAIHAQPNACVSAMLRMTSLKLNRTEVARLLCFSTAGACTADDSYTSMRSMLRSTRWRSTPIRTDQEAVPRCRG